MDNRLLVPIVVESTNRGERSFDIFSRLLRDRIILLGTGIDDQISNLIIAQLLFLAAEDPEKDIQMFINSPGGSVTAGLAIYDTMRYIQPDVSTICVGMAASMATPLLSAGAQGKRYALANSTVHMHPARGGVQGLADDLETTARFYLDQQRRTREIMAKHTGQTIERIAMDFDREKFLTVEEAKEYGIIDDILVSSKELPAPVAAAASAGS
ncbi:MAG: ATP-dependent Clp protease proteolytic subunit [Chloroflexota bacterium]|nr:ATP-dependent Clp protease proteolytic subunit [Chloroflexota bacterium]